MTEREIRSWLMDMDGVLVREEQAIPGADRYAVADRAEVLARMDALLEQLVAESVKA